jgi:hypothetical protein
VVAAPPAPAAASVPPAPMAPPTPLVRRHEPAVPVPSEVIPAGIPDRSPEGPPDVAAPGPPGVAVGVPPVVPSPAIPVSDPPSVPSAIAPVAPVAPLPFVPPAVRPDGASDGASDGSAGGVTGVEREDPFTAPADPSFEGFSRRISRVPPGAGVPRHGSGSSGPGRAKRPSDWAGPDEPGLRGPNAEAGDGAGVEVTASGFRVRERKAPAIASPTWPSTPKPPPPAWVPPAPAAAEQARSTLSSFMTGVNRGRQDTATGPDAEAGPDTDPDPHPAPEDPYA